MVRNARAQECLLYGTRLGIGAIQDGDAVQADWLWCIRATPGHRGGSLFNAPNDPGRLIFGIKCAIDGDLIATLKLGPELLLLATLVVRDDTVCCIKDRLR